MRSLNIGSHNFTKVLVGDAPMDENGACHNYKIGRSVHPVGTMRYPLTEFGEIKFQKGPVKEAGINGCHHEDLIVILIDRLEHFQRGSFRCRENALAITKLEEALLWLNKRTDKRREQGIEGTNEVGTVEGIEAPTSFGEGTRIPHEIKPTLNPGSENVHKGSPEELLKEPAIRPGQPETNPEPNPDGPPQDHGDDEEKNA